ncbi:MAG: hypothetical protein MUF00_15430 [Gemmatimonadaceae bacterium]|jgi:hypothetical protein|nr:hypothetical protein [Gemmatimonadaceae bacterium]
MLRCSFALLCGVWGTAGAQSRGSACDDVRADVGALALPSAVLQRVGPPVANETLDSIARIEVAGARVFVQGVGAQQIDVYAATGRRLRTVGRAGGGPGEFRGLSAFGLRGDTLWTIDAELRRLSFFSADGVYLASSRMAGVAGRAATGRPVTRFALPIAMVADGTLIGTRDYLAAEVARGAVTSQVVVRLSRTGAELDSITAVPMGHDALVLRGKDWTQYREQPFTDGPFVVVARRAGVVYTVAQDVATAADAPSATVTATDVRGRRLWQRVLRLRGSRVSRGEVDSVTRRLESKVGPKFAGAVRGALFVPRFRRPVDAVVADEEGGVWLRLAERSGSSLAVYFVLDRDGRVERCVEAGSRAYVRWVAGDSLWGEVLDADDVPTISRFVVVPGRPAR